MKTILGFVLLCVILSLFSAPVFSAPAQAAQQAGLPCDPRFCGPPPPPPPPPPSDWWELQYWQCDPLSCESAGGPWSVGNVSTTAVGPCFNGLVVEVGEGAQVVNCNPPLFLSSGVTNTLSSLGYVYYNKVYTYILEGLVASAEIYDDYGDVLNSGFDLEWCNGNIQVSLPSAGPC